MNRCFYVLRICGRMSKLWSFPRLVQIERKAAEALRLRFVRFASWARSSLRFLGGNTLKSKAVRPVGKRMGKAP